MASINRIVKRLVKKILPWIEKTARIPDPLGITPGEASVELHTLLANELSKDQPTAEQLQNGPPITFLLNTLEVLKQVKEKLDAIWLSRHGLDSQLDWNTEERITALRHQIQSHLNSYNYEEGEIKEEGPTQTYYDEIQKAHPNFTGQYKNYELALKLVGERHGKYELVDLVNWLLTCPCIAEDGRIIERKEPEDSVT